MVCNNSGWHCSFLSELDPSLWGQMFVALVSPLPFLSAGDLSKLERDRKAKTNASQLYSAQINWTQAGESWLAFVPECHPHLRDNSVEKWRKSRKRYLLHRRQYQSQPWHQSREIGTYKVSSLRTRCIYRVHPIPCLGWRSSRIPFSDIAALTGLTFRYYHSCSWAWLSSSSTAWIWLVHWQEASWMLYTWTRIRST